MKADIITDFEKRLIAGIKTRKFICEIEFSNYREYIFFANRKKQYVSSIILHTISLKDGTF